jgi:hypothetical protein
MSEIKVNKISQRSGTAITLGNSGTDFQLPSGADIVAQSGSTITIASGATITNNGTATGFGATGAVNWDTTPKTANFNAVSGVGYFVNTTSGAITVSLPAATAGNIIAISDYANTAATNKITIDPNGTDKINGLNQNAEITTNGAAVTLIYVDSTRGWKDVNDATLNVTGINPFVLATGGTITTCGDYKIHTFTGPGTFTVTCAGTPTGSNSVEYLVVAGGGSGARGTGGGGGAGGFRQNYPSPTTAGLPVTATGYPITVGGGGASRTPAAPPTVGESGTNSIFSTITSAGGGGGGNNPDAGSGALAGGSGGGASYGNSVSVPSTGAAGNTPPVSPPQGNPGGGGINGPTGSSGGGGGAGAGATTSTCVNTSTAGGAGTATSISGSPLTYAGGGGGGQYGGAGIAGNGGTGGGGGGSVGTGGTPGTGGSPGGGNGTPGGPAGNGGTNTGGGGGGGGFTASPSTPLNSGAGGSGIVVIRYKFQ